MTITPPTPAEKPANLTALQIQLLDLAARSKPVPQDRSPEPRGPVLVIRGKQPSQGSPTAGSRQVRSHRGPEVHGCFHLAFDTAGPSW